MFHVKHLKKFISRKFLISLASFLTAFAMALQGLNSNDETLQVVSVIAMTISSGIYSIIEGIIDKGGITVGNSKRAD